MEKQSHLAADPDGGRDEILAENEKLREELEAARKEIEELALELEEKALALLSSRAEAPAAPVAPPAPAAETAPAAPTAAQPSPQVSSLIRSALSTGAGQAKLRIASLEESLARQAERHAMHIAEMEAHFVQKLSEVAGGGNQAVVRVLRDRIVALEQERADPPGLAQAKATIERLQAELEELRDENRYLSAEVERWASLAQSK